MAFAQGKNNPNRKIIVIMKGENSTTCDPWSSRDFMDEMRNHPVRCHHCLSDCDHITYLPTVTSAEFRWSLEIDTDQEFKILDFVLLQNCCQLLWFTEPEPESLLQPDLDLPGNVATEHPRDLREPDNQLRQSDVGADEVEIPKLHGRERAHIFPCQGYFRFKTNFRSNQSLLSGPGALQCVWKGHRHREHFLWRINRVWSVAILHVSY